MSERELELTEPARTAIRRYLFKLVLPSGAVLGVIASILTYLVQDVATSKTTVKVYDQTNSEIQKLLVKTANAHADASNIRQKIKDIEEDAKSLKIKLDVRGSEIESLVEKTKSSAALVKVEKHIDDIASKLSDRDDFIKKIQFLGQLPVGSVIPSLISPEEFEKLKQDELWVPADGREIPRDSDYFTITGKSQVPDLRGMFLRGLNEFSKGRKRRDGLEDPEGDNRKVGNYQSDEMQKHQHNRNAVYDAGGGINASWVAHKKHFGYGHKNPPPTELAGGTESRPKNVAVYYYIKIYQ